MAKFRVILLALAMFATAGASGIFNPGPCEGNCRDQGQASGVIDSRASDTAWSGVATDFNQQAGFSQDALRTAALAANGGSNGDDDDGDNDDGDENGKGPDGGFDRLWDVVGFG